jgi:formylglycine-generating enzyme
MMRTLWFSVSLLVLGLAPSAVVAGERFALVVGIDDYQALGKLKTCRADARALARVLVERGGFDRRRVVLLTDDAEEPQNRPTFATLRRRITQIASLSGKGDTLLVFFSGHGITVDGQGYLVPMDGDVDTSVSLAWLKDELGKSKAETRMLILDACHAGSAAKGVAVIAPDLTAKADGLAMLLSCGDKEQSYPLAQGGHSAFSAYLIEGLAGAADTNKDQAVTHDELFAYLKKRMTDWCLATGKTQTPRMFPEKPAAPLTLARVIDGKPLDLTRPGDAGRTELPRGWTSETRRVRVATPEGERMRDIVFYRNTVGMTLVKVPAGEFMMGDTLSPEAVHRRWPGGQLEWYKRSHPRHKVRLTRDFYLGAMEVTRGQFAQFVRETNYRTDAEKGGNAWALKDGKWGEQEGVNWRNPLFEQKDDHPVVCVSWNDAVAFCAWLSKKEGVTYGLPTEAEWEYAARAGSDAHTWYWGDDESGAQGRANVAGEGEELDWTYKFKDVKDGYTYTAPVGQFMPNAFGLYDMIGNVWEWCEDRYADKYPGGERTNPTGPATGQTRVLRGGSWGRDPWVCRSAFRDGVSPAYRDGGFGFRLICRDF